jgi:hypothetical protein
MPTQMPQPSEEHKRLHAMAGSWTSEETIHTSPWDPNGGPAKGRSQARVALDGFVVVTDYEQERNGRVSYRGHGVYGYDVGQKKWFMQWLDNATPTAAPTIWGTFEGDVLAFQMQGPTGHHRYVYKFAKDGEYLFSIETSKDGAAWTTFLDGRFTRKPPN